MKYPVVPAALLFLLFSGFAGLNAHDGATGIVKERMVLMKDIGAGMKKVRDMIRGKAAFDAAAIVTVGDRIAAHGKKVPDLFPPGTVSDITRAAPGIHRDWTGFTALSDRMRLAASDLAAAARSGDRKAVGNAFRALGKTCSACHRDFRRK